MSLMEVFPNSVGTRKLLVLIFCGHLESLQSNISFPFNNFRTLAQKTGG